MYRVVSVSDRFGRTVEIAINDPALEHVQRVLEETLGEYFVWLEYEDSLAIPQAGLPECDTPPEKH